MNNTIATYRLQFHKEFNFERFQEIIPYLKNLGVKTIYASPIFQSVPGSTHGYDGINPTEINPEIGTEQQLHDLSKQLNEQGMGWLQDIVPNHMAFHHQNPWLSDVLEKGKLSVYSAYFDINWEHPRYEGKVLLPFLGAPLEEVLDNEIHIAFDGKRLVCEYYEATFPLHPRSYLRILDSKPTHLQDVRQLVDQLETLHQVESPQIFAQQWEEFLMQVASLMKNADVQLFVDECISAINDDKEELRKVLEEQAYQLAYWKKTDTEINFRRFFTVNGLICLNIQDEQVFSSFHQYIAQLKEQGIFQGLRVDHIDGLFDPQKYLNDLRALAGPDTYLVVEKILEQGEKLPEAWPVQGNTGYDFLAMVNNLLTDKSGEKDFSRLYRKITGDKRAIHQQLHDKKAHILCRHMGGELDNLVQLFKGLDLVDDTSAADDLLKDAIAEVLIQCPVYRYYGNSLPLHPQEAEAVRAILSKVKSSKPSLSDGLKLLEEALLVKPQRQDADYNDRALRFYQRLMQFTGPLMAKGVEDTLMYTYNRFIGHNEVGDSPEAFGCDTKAFHKLMVERQTKWPLTMNATATHDTKRGEDVRARLNVLTELSEDWAETIVQWRALNKDISATFRLSANDEYFIYQTLVGAMPMPGTEDPDFESRVHEYLIKSLREGKQNSDWATPNDDYEERAKGFASALLDPDKPFSKLLQKFTQKIADYGMLNSLTQLALKFTCPGIPDVYQGCELWDLSLVDPDNRRPVDYARRAQLLAGLDALSMEELWKNRASGQIKLWFTNALFQLRKEHSDWFTQADYLPLKVKGKYRKHVFAFARRLKGEWIIIALPLHVAKLSRKQEKSLLNLKWKDTRIILPNGTPEQFRHLLSNSEGLSDGELLVKNLFTTFPLAILKMQKPQSERGAGVLLHITSLPSNFGIGDLGPGARAFADYLSRASQKYWQLLPLNPTEDGQGYSPYSAISSMAGNTLLISPELLAADGLLDAKQLERYTLKSKNTVDFAGAKKFKDRMFDEAYHHFSKGEHRALQTQFDDFCSKEASWLTDFSLYLALKRHHQSKPWFEWQTEYKMRDDNALITFSEAHQDVLRKIKWLQFIFFKQWEDLKKYCNDLDIQLFGDLPFYVSADSSDVWANREIFCLDAEGKMTNVAGVPPDYFNDNGQLWGMPVFRWDVLKKQNYSWWVNRIKKNMQLYDLLRLDHFRAFSTYWDVPAGEQTAKNGEWKPGPGADFFRVMQQELGDLPFVAEDLGDVDQAVYDLRDDFSLPGMRVVQFSFGDDLAQSVHSPHNFDVNSVAYTGTHDNNTSRGWFRNDTAQENKNNISAYSRQRVREKDIHLALGQLAYSSVAKIAILPMQDILGLDERARMNTPASVEKNWLWRLKPKQMKAKYAKRLRKWVKMYNR